MIIIVEIVVVVQHVSYILFLSYANIRESSDEMEREREILIGLILTQRKAHVLYKSNKLLALKLSLPVATLIITPYTTEM